MTISLDTSNFNNQPASYVWHPSMWQQSCVDGSLSCIIFGKQFRLQNSIEEEDSPLPGGVTVRTDTSSLGEHSLDRHCEQRKTAFNCNGGREWSRTNSGRSRFQPSFQCLRQQLDIIAARVHSARAGIEIDPLGAQVPLHVEPRTRPRSVSASRRKNRNPTPHSRRVSSRST